MTTSTLRRAAPPAPTRPALVEFFRHHGAWAPGVRLFRRLQFSAKAGIISAAFIVPIAVLAWAFYGAKSESIGFSDKERLGVAYAQALMPVLTDASRAHPGDLTAPLKRLAEAEKTLGPTLGTAALHAKATQAAAELTRAAQPAEAQAGAEAALRTALLALLGQSTDGSNLTLDPDLDSYYLMDASLFRLPQIMATLADLRSTAGATDPMQAVRIARAETLIAYHLDQVQQGLAKSITATPALGSALQVQAGTASLVTLQAALQKASTTPGAEATLDVRLIDDALAAQTAFSDRLLRELDHLVAVRVAGFEAERHLITVVIVLSLALGAYLFRAFFLVTQDGLREVEKHLQALTAGDLTTQPRPWGRDEAARLMGTLVEMQGSLRGIVREVRQASDHIVQASAEIASASVDLSSRTEATSANLEESAASMEQIASSARQTAQHASEAATLAATNAGDARQGGEVIGQVVQTMQDIHRASTRIADIIGTIDGIAFQTNILALNASVEAARAGEQGRGFAVVAGEVRSLAQRSAQAAKEIKSLIGASVEHVSAGTQIVEGAGRSVGALVGHAQEMDQLIAGISTAAREQSAGVAQVGSAVQELDRMTQQNAALVEETAAAAASLQSQAEDLAGRVARFKLPA